ncbi:hypothetical protein Tco_1234633 [Tanacetum coccineum]
MGIAQLVGQDDYWYNGLAIGEMVAEIPKVVGDDDDEAEQAEIREVGRHPTCPMLIGLELWMKDLER